MNKFRVSPIGPFLVLKQRSTLKIGLNRLKIRWHSLQIINRQALIIKLGVLICYQNYITINCAFYSKGPTRDMTSYLFQYPAPSPHVTHRHARRHNPPSQPPPSTACCHYRIATIYRRPYKGPTFKFNKICKVEQNRAQTCKLYQNCFKMTSYC